MTRLSRFLQGAMALVVLPTGMAAYAAEPPACRTIATEYRTHQTAPGFTSDRDSGCSFERAALELRCRHRYRDNRGSANDSREVARYQSLNDFLAELTVIAPLRKALWISTVREGTGAHAYRTSYEYDSLGRLLRETTPDETIRYTAWDQAGHPTAGSGSTQNASSRLQLSYGELTAITTKSSNYGSVTCTQHFDQSGNQISTSCVGPGPFRSQSQTTITASAKVCK